MVNNIVLCITSLQKTYFNNIRYFLNNLVINIDFFCLVSSFLTSFIILFLSNNFHLYLLNAFFESMDHSELFTSCSFLIVLCLFLAKLFLYLYCPLHFLYFPQYHVCLLYTSRCV